MRTYLILLLFLIPTSVRAQTPQQRYQAAATMLKAHSPASSYGFYDDGSPQAIEALAAMWQAAADTAANFLTSNPDPGPETLTKSLCSLDPPGCAKDGNFGQQVLRLGPGLFLISVTIGETGTVFVVGPRSGHPMLLWSIASAKPQPLDHHHLLAAWRLSTTSESCRKLKRGSDWGQCGPAFGSIKLLPPDAEGHPRFYIDGEYAQGAGATVGKQISIWRWNDTAPQLLWIAPYAAMLDQENGNSYQQGILTITEKQEYRSFSSCGSCEGRQVALQLRISPRSIQYLSKHTLDPTMDQLDTLIWRMGHRQTVAQLASSQVIAFLKPTVLDSTRDLLGTQPNSFSIGMGGRAGEINQTNTLCANLDPFNQLIFTLTHRPNGSVYFAHVKEAKAGECTEPQGRSPNSPGPSL